MTDTVPYIVFRKYIAFVLNHYILNQSH